MTTWTSQAGKQIVVTLQGIAEYLNVSVDGSHLGSGQIGKADSMFVPAAIQQKLATAGLSHVIIGAGVLVGVPAAAAAEIDTMIAASIDPRKAGYNRLNAIYQSAKHAAEQAREAAYGTDTGAGFDRVKMLDDAAERARLAVVAVGDYHNSDDMVDAQD